METAKLFQEAQDSDIPILYLSIPENGSLYVQTDRRCYIGRKKGTFLWDVPFFWAWEI